MKKKILSMIITLGMVCGLCACGNAGEKAATFIIEDETYNLSGDFQDVVGSMVENDLQVAYYLFSLNDTYVFDEDGKCYLSEDFDKDEPYIYAMERCENSVPENDELGSFIRKIYMFDENVEFEAKLGFDSDSDKKEIKDLEGFMKCTQIIHKDNDTYVAMFVDGEMVDFEEYEEPFEEWKEEFDGTKSFSDTLAKYFPENYYPQLVCRMFMADYLKMGRDYDEIMERAEDSGFLVKEEMILAFAMQDACELLEEGEAQKVVVIRIEISEDYSNILEYNEFFFDDDWEPEKNTK